MEVAGYGGEGHGAGAPRREGVAEFVVFDPLDAGDVALGDRLVGCCCGVEWGVTYGLDLAAEVLCDCFSYRGLLSHTEDSATHAGVEFESIRLRG